MKARKTPAPRGAGQKVEQKAGAPKAKKADRTKYSMRADLHADLKFVASATNVKLMDLIDQIAERAIRSWEKMYQVRIDELRGRR